MLETFKSPLLIIPVLSMQRTLLSETFAKAKAFVTFMFSFFKSLTTLTVAITVNKQKLNGNKNAKYTKTFPRLISEIFKTIVKPQATAKAIAMIIIVLSIKFDGFLISFASLLTF